MGRPVLTVVHVREKASSINARESFTGIHGQIGDKGNSGIKEKGIDSCLGRSMRVMKLDRRVKR